MNFVFQISNIQKLVKIWKKVIKGNGPEAGLEPALSWHLHKTDFDATAATVIGKG